MNRTAKSITIGGVTGLSVSGLIDLINYCWQFTPLPDLPDSTVGMLAALVAGILYRVLPQSSGGLR